ncbi:S-adenosyl-L-methionine-dependent methyltransferase [Schizophyllum commune Loenen D]|nr:S-adenosyl-L-methionine-dependent methyltransferase [Schizophyllum commune Loenen D]
MTRRRSRGKILLRNPHVPLEVSNDLRLQAQHDMIIRVFNGRLITAPVNLLPGTKVLDSATGTGIRALQASTQYQEISFTGIDIESRNLPTSPPPNTEFLVHNITALPEEWSGTFDLVHQRLLIAALRTEEWPRAIGEAHRVLKPGGWVQIVELSLLSLQRGPVGRRLWDVFRAFSEARTMLSTCAEDIPQMLKDVGFCNVRNELSIIGAYRRLRKAIVQEGGFGIVGSGEEYDALLDELDREFETGVNGSYPMEFVAVVAQKA